MKRRVLNTKRNKKALRTVLSALHARPPFTVVVDASFIRFASESFVENIADFVTSAFGGEKCRLFCNGSTKAAVEQWASSREGDLAAKQPVGSPPPAKKKQKVEPTEKIEQKISKCKMAGDDSKKRDGAKNGINKNQNVDSKEKRSRPNPKSYSGPAQSSVSRGAGPVAGPEPRYLVSREVARRALHFIRVCEPWHMSEGDRGRSERKALAELVESWSEPIFVATQSYGLRSALASRTHVLTLRMSSNPNQIHIDTHVDVKTIPPSCPGSKASDDRAAGERDGAKQCVHSVVPTGSVPLVSAKDRAFMTNLGNASGSARAKATILKAVRKIERSETRLGAPVKQDVMIPPSKRKAAKKAVKGVNPLSNRPKKKRETFVSA